MPTVTTATKGARVSVSRDGQAVGYASRVPRAGTWTAFVYIAEPPFDALRTGFPSADAATAFIAEHGTPR